jgi:hypothetical protein
MQSKEFDSQIQRLTGDCAVASAFVSYLGPFNKEFRELLMSRDFYGDCIKLNIPVTQSIEVGSAGSWVVCNGDLSSCYTAPHSVRLGLRSMLLYAGQGCDLASLGNSTAESPSRVCLCACCR